ncbi:RHS repeat-associated protein [Micromonospora pisi]|uniref:RHS repeat-associated protein n=1 Tax=Micromonospora pisi TaxID=589240 RepID=A0A495JV82_9ACTN|nr:RHS repeat-associated core domain-containing protein [Micromonospora pisi]RKR92913.1 RHS repeat-associated protein [Micromonospora pisi]
MAGTTQAAAAPGVRISQLLVGSDVANVVNMFRGEVNIPLDLVALGGRGGLDVTVTAFYSSGVHRMVNRSNLTEPTDLLGVGWSMPYERIMVESQTSGTNVDDVFYLVTGGSPRQLVRVGVDGAAQLFQLRDHQFWKIRYFPDAARPECEYWEVVRDDGSTYTYGLGSVQRGVRWGNWIGPSTLAGGASFPVAWNLCTVQSMAGDTMSFEYDVEDVTIGAGADARYTRSCRLRRIIDVFGRTVDFCYLRKDPYETPAPRIPPHGGGNAYQYRLDDHYLHQIVVRDATGTLMLTTELSYELCNVSGTPGDAYTKRYLVAVGQTVASGASVPELRFDYHGADAPNPGTLRGVLTPQGARTTFEYATAELPNTRLRVPVTSPGAGWTPRVWHGPTYTVITWENPTAGQVTTGVYSWNGSWSSQQETREWAAVPGTLRVLTGDGFFAVWYRDARAGQYTVNLVRADEFRFGQWQRTPYQVNLAKPMTDPAVSVGAGFVAVADAAAGQLKIISWDLIARRWTEHAFSLAGVTQVSLASGVNFCVATSYATTGRTLSTGIYRADADGRWRRGDTTTENVDVDWDTTRPDRMLAAGPSFAALGFVTAIDQGAQTVRYATRLLTWSTTYTFGPVVRADGSQPLAARNPVGFAVVNGATVGNGQHLFRFDGARWQQVTAARPVTGPRYSYAYAADTAYATTMQDNGQWAADLYEYDPYRNAWGTPKRASGAGAAPPTLAEGWRTAGRDLLRRTPDGAWTTAYTLPADADLTTLRNQAPAYLTYQDRAGTTHVLTLADATVRDAATLADERVVVTDPQPGQILTGPATFVTYRGTDFDKSTALTLYRVVDTAVATRLAAHPVVKVTTDTGYDQQHTTVDYDLATATYDPYGLVTQFVTVCATPGDGGAGRVERVFFNGLSPSVPGVVYPVSDEYSNARGYFSQLNGQLFRVRGFDAQGRQVQESLSYPYTYTSGNSDQRIAGAYTRSRRKSEATAAQLLAVELPPAPADAAGDLDRQTVPGVLRDRFATAGLPLGDPVTVAVESPGRRWALTDATGTGYQVVADPGRLTVYGWLTDVTDYEYNSAGQLCRELVENVDDTGVRRRLRRDTTYAWQAYPQLRQRNCLVPVSQVTSTDLTEDLVTDSAVTTYSDTCGPWSADRAYQWLGVGVPDFPAWAADADPGPGWLRVRQVLAVTDRAQPLAALDAGDHIAALAYDRGRRFAVATVANADPRAGEASYYGFEEYEQPGGWTLTPTGLDPADYITEGPAHAGSRRLAIPGNPTTAVGITNTFAPARGDRNYQLSCWVCTGPGFVRDQELAAWRITVVGTQGGSASIVLAIPATDEQWRWLHQLIDPQALGVGEIRSLTATLTSRQDRHYLLVDDVAFAPVQASLRASVYSSDGQELRGTVDLLGDSRRIAYDLLGRPVVEIGPDGSPLAMSADQFWRRERDSFDPARPNGSLMVAFRQPGSYTDFRQGGQWQARWQPSAGWRQTPGRLCHEGADTGTLTLREPLTGSHAIRFGLAADSATTPRLSFGGGWSVRWAQRCWSLHQPDGGQVTSSTGPAGTDLLLLVWPHRVLWWVDGGLTLQHINEDGFSGPVELAADGALALRWIAVGTDPLVGVSWTDNAGRPRELQRVADTRIRVSATGYDQTGREIFSTKAVELDGEPVGYRPGLVTSLDPRTGAMGDCELTRAYPDDEGYPFSRTVFEASPLGRPVEAGLPGRAFAVDTREPVGQRHTTRTEYRVNTCEPLLSDLPAGQYQVTVSVDPDGRTASTWTDRLGRSVAAVGGDLAGAAGTFSLVRNFYDPYGNLVRRQQPNVVDARVSDRDNFVEHTDYDFLGNPVAISGPDLDGTAYYVYDTLGRLRFSQSPRNAAQGCLCYRRYDNLGRLIETGTCAVVWNRQELQRHADDPTWLPAPGTWLTRYRYDGDGGNPQLYGRLWQTCSGPAVGDTPVTRTTYAYNDLGLVSSRTVSLAAYADGAPHTVAFGYDATGAVTDVTYDAQLAADAFTARLAADGFNEIVAVTGEHDGQTTELARFAYHGSGALVREVLAPGDPAELSRTYQYTPPGWLASVSDRYLTETTDYTSGGHDDAGYHDGRAARVTSRFTGVTQDGFVADFHYRYGYDCLGRLTVAENSVDEEYGVSGLTYDANGNVTARTVGAAGQRFRYRDGTNRLLVVDDGVEHDPLVYDPDGQVTEAPPAGVRDLRYGPISGLPESLRGAAGQLRLERDAEGTLLFRAGPDGQRLYLPGTNTAPLALHHVDTAGEQRVGYLIPGPGGTIAVWSPAGTLYVLRGRLGSTRGLYDAAGLAGAFSYLPYGGFLGTPLDRGATSRYPYLFTGVERDPVTGLYLFPQRVYDPGTGRFLSTDPAAQYPSPYLYAGCDPVNRYDPSGAFSWPAFGAIVGGVAAFLGGVALTVLTAGAAAPLVILAGVVGGGLIGAGIASAAYGFGHADYSNRPFDKTEWGISVGLGAAFGMAAAGLGFVAAALPIGVGMALGIETFIGVGLGALDGFVSNGSLNAYHGGDFLEGGGLAAGLGAVGGAAGGVVGGVLGRGPMLRTSLTLRAGRRTPADARGELFVRANKKRPTMIWGHLRVATQRPGKAPELSELLHPRGTEAGVYKAGDLLAGTWRRIGVPAENAGRAEDYALAMIADSAAVEPQIPPYSYLTNNCTTYVQSVLRKADVHSPLWARTPATTDFWMSLVGTRWSAI